jgi:amidase
VAAGLTTLEIGSDINGSIRIPAHFCGVFGLKPTENMPMHGEGHVPPVPNSRGGFVAMASVGPLARTMSDIELGWRQINRQAWSYFSHLPSKPRVKNALSDYRIAWFDNAGRVECGNETRTTLGALIQRLESAGVKCENRPFDPSWLDQAYAVWGQLYGTMLGQDAPWLLRQVLKFRFARMGTGASIDLAAPVKTGLGLDFKGFSRALEQRKELVKELQRRFDDYDFIISPVATGPAFAHNPKHAPIELDGRTISYLDYAMPFVTSYNACGNPALVIPAGRSGGGLPIGLQIAAPHYAEDELIHFGTLVERLGATFAPPRGYE